MFVFPQEKLSIFVEIDKYCLKIYGTSPKEAILLKLTKRIACLIMTLTMLTGIIVIPTTQASAADASAAAASFPGVAFWGDSLTFGTGGQTPFPKVFQNKINSTFGVSIPDKKIANRGEGGDMMDLIAARSNGTPFTVSSRSSGGTFTAGFTIYSSSSKALDQFTVRSTGQTSTDTKTYNMFAQPRWYFNASGGLVSTANTKSQPATIEYATGKTISGTISYATNLLVTFRPNSYPSSNISVPKGAKIYLDDSTYLKNNNYIPVVYIGTNNSYLCDLVEDGRGMTNFEFYVNKILNYYGITNYKNPEKPYVVILPHFTDENSDNSSYKSKIQHLQSAAKARYGDHLIDLRTYMTTQALSDAGISPSSSDRSRMAAGKCPSSLLINDLIHYNQTGYNLVGNLVFKKFDELGYFNGIRTAMGMPTTGGGTGGGGTAHTHSMTLTAAKAATCAAAGNSAYYTCSGCNKYFSDQSGTKEITLASTVIPKLTTHTPGAPATCTAAQTCTVCGATVAAAKGHTLGSTYSYDKNGHWFACTVCGEKGPVNVHINSTTNGVTTCVLCGYSEHSHVMVQVPAKAATCLAEGNIAHYSCTACGKLYSDVGGTNEITAASVVTAKTAHSFGTALTGDASGHYTKCTVCSEKGTVNSHVANVVSATTATAKYCVLCNYIIEPKLEDTTPPDTTPSTVVGDTNNDGTKNIADVNYMLNYILFGEAQYPKHQDMDYNKDGKINTSDATVLLNSVIFGSF